MTKSDLRAVYKKKRTALSQTDVEELSMVIAQRVLNEISGATQHVHIFSTIQKFNEPDTSFLAKQLMTHGHFVYTSVIEKENMKFNNVKIDLDTKFQTDSWGIPVPVNPVFAKENTQFDIILVPLLCCDIRGNRVGYGKGFYDAFLKYQPNALKLGICFFEPVSEIEDVASHDVRINTLITPDKTFYFDNAP
ncbi:MAG TPA: 5-formyltetrahydrofolate cyclo-ligase [Flavobacteriales bacterium]|nr:5-formyltetrahydrofolate cyclo-ligase [Flavobacteriales bacterium]